MTQSNRTIEDLRALAARVIAAQEEERRRLGRELHRDLAQGLAVLEIQLQSARVLVSENTGPVLEVLERVSDECRALSERVRVLSHSLFPSILADLGLEAALRNLIQDFAHGHHLAIRIEIDSAPAKLPLPVSTALYRVAQEALDNIAKHAPHALVTVTLSQNPEVVNLNISDNGPGFNPHRLPIGAGLGLLSMQERMRHIGGVLQVCSKPGAGTTISASVPWA